MMTAEIEGQMQRAFWEMHLLISRIVPECAHWVVQVTVAFLVPWLIPEKPNINQGGANVRARNTQAHLGPRIWVNSMAQGLDFHPA